MPFLNVTGLLGLAALPVIALLYAYRRRPPVRHVAGLFLWGASSPSVLEPRDSQCGIRPWGPLARDLAAALVLVLLACAASRFGSSEGRLAFGFRFGACTAVAILLVANWRPVPPGDPQRRAGPVPLDSAENV